MEVQRFVFNPFQENTYVLYDTVTKQCVVIDPGMCHLREWDEMKDWLEARGLTPTLLLLTHCHLDHMLGSGYLAEKFGLMPSGPLEDYEKLPSPQHQAMMFGLSCPSTISPVVKNIKEGDEIPFGDTTIQVLDISGHSFHGLCYYLPKEKLLFSGDVLFYGSIGRSDFGEEMGGNGERLIEGIQCKLLSLPQETVVYPGHGPQTTIGQELQINPFI
ncbi:MAG: MBL fold metallo-hydrolase [Bacteroidales bacterium]|nr:MBL fold metallo-hydrolase [Bacteroidales bacterium]